MSYQVTKLFHPTLRSPDLEATEAWFERVFGRVGRRTSTSPKVKEIAARNYPTDYATFTAIGDVILDTLDPSRYVVNGEQMYPSITEHELKELAWYVDGIDELFAEMRSRGMNFIRQRGSEPDAIPPVAAFADLTLFWTDPDETGLRYELYDPRGGMMDPRKYDGWDPDQSIAPSFTEDPFGITIGAYHVVLTNDTNRALNFYQNLLNGQIIAESDSELFDAKSTYVSLGDCVYEIAEPNPGSDEEAALSPHLPYDKYHSIVWQVKDLAKVRGHLTGEGVRFREREGVGLLTDPVDSVNVPFGFTEQLISGDPRSINTSNN